MGLPRAFTWVGLGVILLAITAWVYWALHPVEPLPDPAEIPVRLEAGGEGELFLVANYDGLYEVELRVFHGEPDGVVDRYVRQWPEGEAEVAPLAEIEVRVAGARVDAGPAATHPTHWSARGAGLVLGEFRPPLGAEIRVHFRILRTIPELRHAQAHLEVGPYGLASEAVLGEDFRRALIVFGSLATGVSVLLAGAVVARFQRHRGADAARVPT